MAYIVNETRTLTTYKTMSIIYASHACRNPETAIEFCFFRFLRPLSTSISNPAVRAGEQEGEGTTTCAAINSIDLH